MKNLLVLRYTEAESLGGLEDQFRNQGIGYSYHRPLSVGKGVTSGVNSDGLVILGAGAWGTNGERTTLPTLTHELRIAYDHMKRNRPILGFGLGSQIVSIAAGGGSEPSPCAFEVGMARRVREDALGGLMPERFPYAIFMRDRPVLPHDAEILAVDEHDRPLAFTIGRDVICFTCNPGFGPSMLRDLVRETEAGTGEAVAALAAAAELEADAVRQLPALADGIVRAAGWVQAAEALAGGG